jgi:hypothetical protein
VDSGDWEVLIVAIGWLHPKDITVRSLQQREVDGCRHRLIRSIGPMKVVTVYKRRDERGLLLLVRPSGAKWWRLRYEFQGKENMLNLGGDYVFTPGEVRSIPCSAGPSHRATSRRLQAALMQ